MLLRCKSIGFKTQKEGNGWQQLITKKETNGK